MTAKKKLSREKDEEHVATEEKQRELRELKEIVEKQARIIEDL